MIGYAIGCAVIGIYLIGVIAILAYLIPWTNKNGTWDRETILGTAVVTLTWPWGAISVAIWKIKAEISAVKIKRLLKEMED